jgi:O-antigen biosynthesis protein
MKLLIIGTVWPEPRSSAAGSRMIQLIELFRAEDWQVTFATAAQKSEHSVNLSSLGVIEVAVKLNDASFNEFVSDLEPNVVMFDRFMTEEQFGWRVKKECPQALLLLDLEDLHFLRSARQLALKEGRNLRPADLKSEQAIREIASIYRCDLSLVISSFEVDLLATEFSIHQSMLHYLPFMAGFVTEDEKSGLPNFSQRQHFVTIGNFLHPPNWDSVQYLNAEIWPLIRKELPDAEMHVFGAYASEKHHQLNNPKTGFLIKGRAEDALKKVSEHRVMLAPLRFGAGLKGKLLESMQSGTPSVTTTIGSEAMHANLPWNGMVENDPAQFALAAVKLYSEETSWLKAQSVGFDIVNQLFANREHAEALIEKVRELKSELANHRNQNFIGSMLHHHTMRSTEFMSRWIEEKSARGTS